MMELPIEHVKLMQPILTKKDRQELIDAGIVIFDHKMSKGNKYILHIPRLLELVRGLTTKEAEGSG